MGKRRSLCQYQAASCPKSWHVAEGWRRWLSARQGQTGTGYKCIKLTKLLQTWLYGTEAARAQTFLDGPFVVKII